MKSLTKSKGNKVEPQGEQAQFDLRDWDGTTFQQITADLSIELLEEVVLVNGEYKTNDRLKYLDSVGNPCCLIAHALVRGGVPTEVLRRADLTDINSVDDFDEFSNYCTSDALKIFASAQTTADSGYLWCDALEDAKDYYYDNVRR